jgi:hypothetical protein
MRQAIDSRFDVAIQGVAGRAGVRNGADLCPFADRLSPGATRRRSDPPIPITRRSVVSDVLPQRIAPIMDPFLWRLQSADRLRARVFGGVRRRGPLRGWHDDQAPSKSTMRRWHAAVAARPATGQFRSVPDASPSRRYQHTTGENGVEGWLSSGDHSWSKVSRNHNRGGKQCRD